MQKPKWAYIIQFSSNMGMSKKLEHQTWDSCDVFLAKTNDQILMCQKGLQYSIILVQVHCIAARITAENPDDGFKPTSGKCPAQRIQRDVEDGLMAGVGRKCSGARGHPLWLEILFVGLKTYVLVLQTLGDPQTKQLDGWTVRTDVTAMWILKLSLGWGMIMDDLRIITYLVIWWFHDFIQTSLAYNQSTSRKRFTPHF